MGKLLSLGARLRYPITITKLLKARGDSIKKQEAVLEYSFKWMKEVGDHVSGETWQEEQTTIASWDSPVDGKLQAWRLREGDAVHKDMPCMEVEESCSHEMQFHGMCAYCGEDMTEVSWASDQADTHRATVNMTHDQTGLMVSNELAARAEHDAQRRLLAHRKLSLVVDLDQTIIHACIEPTVGDWMNDSSNPNHEAVKHVEKFQLNDEGPRGPVTSTCWYYIKMRPGLKEFLEKIAELYELHVYTMGTRAYALNIARIVDPQQKLFGNRVISRDENGSLISKDLHRLFPVSTNMVVIIDDRADVWPRNRPNLIKVVPYDFFKGIGDINSSFLPKRNDILPSSPSVPNGKTQGAVSPDSKPETNTHSSPSTTGEKPSALAELVSMSSGDDKQLQKEQIEEQEKELEQQLKDRPLLHAQEALDKRNEEIEKAEEDQDGSGEVNSVHRTQVLRDDDRELEFLQTHLTDLHADFYAAYDAKRAARRESPPKQAPSHDKPRRKSQQDDGVDLSMVPDVGEVLDELKAKVLQDTVIVLSGIVPLGIDVTQSDIGLQAMSYGAQIETRVSKRVTHVVVSSARIRTQKAQQAAKIPSIKIVSHDWLAHSLSQWKHLDEEPYLVHVSSQNGDVRGQNGTESDARPAFFDDEDEAGDSEENEEGFKDDDAEFGPEKGSLSPVEGGLNLDWDVMNAEIDEFLASDSDDDDGNSDKSESGTESRNGADSEVPSDNESQETPTPSGTKRKADEEGSQEIEGSALAKRQRVSKDRGASKLSAVEEADSSSLPTPKATEEEGNGGGGRRDDDPEDLDDLEAAMERELAAAEQ